MKSKTKNTLKLIILGIAFLYLITSTYRLMGIPEQQPIQVEFGLIYYSVLLMAIHKRILSIKIIEENKKNLIDKMYRNFKLWVTIIFPIFGIYSAYIFILATNQITNIFFSSIWLQLLIISYQSIPFLILSYQLKESTSIKIMEKTFFFSFISLSIIFGWASAQIAFNILHLPAQQDLFIATYGQLIMPFIFIIYFDKLYSYLEVF